MTNESVPISKTREVVVPLSSAEKRYQNPIGNWEHTGAFSVEFIRVSDVSLLPASVSLEDLTVLVHDGSVEQVAGVIQMYAAPIKEIDSIFYVMPWSASAMEMRRYSGATTWRPNPHSSNAAQYWLGSFIFYTQKAAVLSTAAGFAFTGQRI